MGDRIRAAGEHPVAYGVATGRFSPERVDFWQEAYRADPVGTAATIESMAPILAARSSRWLVAAAASAPVEADEVDEFAGLFPPTAAEYDTAVTAHAARVAAMSDEELEAELFGPEA